MVRAKEDSLVVGSLHMQGIVRRGHSDMLPVFVLWIGIQNFSTNLNQSETLRCVSPSLANPKLTTKSEEYM